MTNTNDARRAHDVLDGLFAGRILSRENEQLLRSFLPEMPKQKTLEEITAHVYDAWLASSDYEFNGNEYDPDVTIEDWLLELHKQLKGLKDKPVAVPALPAGMRLADHGQYGRVVVSPKSDANGVCEILYADNNAEIGATYDYAHQCELTFIDAEPAKPTHPEFLETEAGYENAPVGTVVIREGGYPWTRIFDSWVAYSRNDYSHSEMAALRGKSRVLRWAVGNEQL